MDDPAAIVLDLRGLRCPQPVLRTRKRLRALLADTVLLVETTDPLAAIDLPNLVRETGDLLLGVDRQDDVTVFRIRTRPAVEFSG